MVYFLYTLFFISCISLIASVLLQPGKTDAGALFTSNISSTAFQPRGSQTILSKITIVAATTFMLSALLLAMPALTGNISVLDTVSETPATDANTNTNAADANTNTNAAIDTNTNAAVNSNANSSTVNLPLTPESVNVNSVSNSATNANTTANKTAKTNAPPQKSPAKK